MSQGMRQPVQVRPGHPEDHGAAHAGSILTAFLRETSLELRRIGRVPSPCQLIKESHAQALRSGSDVGGGVAMALACTPTGPTEPDRSNELPSGLTAPSGLIPLEVRAALSAPNRGNTEKPYVRYYSREGVLVEVRELSKAELRPFAAQLRDAVRSKSAGSRHGPNAVSVSVVEESALVEPWTENGFEYSIESAVSSGQQVTVLWQDSVVVNAGWYSVASSGDSTVVTSVTFQNYYPDGGLLLEVGFPTSALEEINGGGGGEEGEPETASAIGCIGSIFALVGTTIG